MAAGAPDAEHLLAPSWWEAARRGPAAQVQRGLSRAIRTHTRRLWLRDAHEAARARLHTRSGWGSAAALLRCPTEIALPVPDDAVRVEVCERLGLPLCVAGRCGLRFQSGRRCRDTRRGGAHVHCCKGTIGARTRYRHNPLVEEVYRFLSMAGRFVALEQRDPSMGPRARLDIVEYPSVEGGPAAYDVSVVTALRKSRAFVAHCADVPGYAGAVAHDAKL